MRTDSKNLTTPYTSGSSPLFNNKRQLTITNIIDMPTHLPPSTPLHQAQAKKEPTETHHDPPKRSSVPKTTSGHIPTPSNTLSLALMYVGYLSDRLGLEGVGELALTFALYE
jgi:hypothetical protein